MYRDGEIEHYKELTNDLSSKVTLHENDLIFAEKSMNAKNFDIKEKDDEMQRLLEKHTEQ